MEERKEIEMKAIEKLEKLIKKSARMKWRIHRYFELYDQKNEFGHSLDEWESMWDRHYDRFFRGIARSLASEWKDNSDEYQFCDDAEYQGIINFKGQACPFSISRNITCGIASDGGRCMIDCITNWIEVYDSISNEPLWNWQESYQS